MIERLEFREAHEVVEGRAAARAAGCGGGGEDGDVVRLRALRHHRVEVVVHQIEARIVHTAIHEVIVVVAGVQSGLGVAHQVHHREMQQPLLDVHGGARAGRGKEAGLILAHHFEHCDHVRPVVLARIGLFEIRVLIRTRRGAAIIEVWRADVALHLVGVAAAVVREMVLGPITANVFVGRVMIVRRRAARTRAAVHAQLRREGFRPDRAGLQRQHRAEVLRPRIDRIHVHAAPVPPRRVGNKTNPVVVRGGAAAAVAPVAHRAEVAHLRALRVEADESIVERRVALRRTVEEAAEFRHFAGRENDFVQRRAAGVSRVVHLVERVHAETVSVHNRHTVRVHGGTRPGVRLVRGVHGLHVKFHYRQIRLRRNARGPQPVTRRTVAVRAVIEHRRAGERGRSAVVHAPEERDGGGRRVVNDARGNHHGVRGLRNERRVAHVHDERDGIAGGDGIRDAGRAVDRGAGGPVLSALVGQGRVDQFQRTTETVGQREPGPALIAQII